MNNIYIVKVKGNINKFLYKSNINILNINYISQREFIIKIHKEDYKKLIKIYGFKYKIINKYGLEKTMDLLKKYNVFIMSFFIGFILLLCLSNTIFEIEINSDNIELKNIIRKELEIHGIKKYNFKKTFKENNIIKNKIKEKYKNNIEWIEIKNNGTKIIVNIIERKIDNTKESNNYYSIVAKKSGFIKKIIVTNGIKVIEENNYVSKDDVIISSDIYLNDDLKGKVNAEGKVYASVWYKVICEYPINYKEKVYTKKKKKTLFIKIGNKYIDFFRYKNFDRKILFKVNDKLTNISIGIEEIKKVEIKNKKYTKKEALKNAMFKSNNVIQNRLKDDEYIINQKTLKFNSNGSKILLETFFSVYEDISEKRIIEENNNG